MANKIFVKTVVNKIYELDLDQEQDKKFYYHYKTNPFLDDFEKEGLIIAEAKTREELEVKCKVYSAATIYGENDNEKIIACWEDAFVTEESEHIKHIYKYSDYQKTWWFNKKSTKIRR